MKVGIGRTGKRALRLIRLLKGELAREARGWVDEGLVERDQADAILARYGASLDDSGRHSLGQRVLTALAVLFFGVSLLILIGHNWDEMPRMARMLGLIGLTLGLNLHAIRLWWRGRERTAELWWFAGGISYGISIMLIAQIYHLGEHYPDGIFWWAAGVLPLALLTGSRLLHLLQLSLAALWLLVELPFSLPLLFPVFALAALWSTLYRRDSLLLFMGAILAAGFWANGAWGWWLDARWPWLDAGAVGLNAGLALLTYALALVLATSSRRIWQEYGLVLKIWLLRGLLLVLFFFSFQEGWREFLRGWQRDGGPALGWLLVVAGLLMAAMAKLTLPARKRLWLALVPTLLLFALAWWVPASAEAALWLAVLVNLVLLGLAVGLLARGLESAQSHLFYTGVVVLLVLALLRYLDLIGDYIGGSVMFAIAGLVLMAAARFWRRRTGGEDTP